MRRVIILLAAMVLLRPTYAVSAPDSSMWTDHERGWFWYEPVPKDLPEEPPVGPPPPATAAPAPPKPVGPLPLSAEWIRENLEKYQRLAIDNPTPENVAAYLYIQRVMLDKSQRFAEQVKHVVQLDPFLDQGTRRPLASYGGARFSQEARAARKRILAQVAQQAGIFFFFQGECGHCEIQAPVLKSLADLYGFVVFPISVDGQPLQNRVFPQFVRDRGQARHLRVIQTPAMYLGKPNTKDIIPLGQSAQSRDQLEQRILVAARDAGWITPEEYERTRGFKTEMALDLRPDSLPADLSEPDLIAYIKKLYSERLARGVGGGDSPQAAENCGECRARDDLFLGN